MSYVYRPSNITRDNEQFNQLMITSINLYHEIDKKHQKRRHITTEEAAWFDAFKEYSQDITKHVLNSIPTKEHW